MRLRSDRRGPEENRCLPEDHHGDGPLGWKEAQGLLGWVGLGWVGLGWVGLVGWLVGWLFSCLFVCLVAGLQAANNSGGVVGSNGFIAMQL